MKISVVIPTLNAAKFLEHALGSIRLQNHQDYEILLVDGGSEDNTLFLARTQPKMTIIHAPPKGEPNAINIGLSNATGDILAWLDADDTYEIGCFEAVSSWFSNHPQRQWVYGKCKVINARGRECRSWITQMKEAFQHRYSYDSLLLGDFIAQPACFFTKDAFSQVGPLDETEKLAFDYDYWLRLGQVSVPGYIPQYLANWRAQPESETAKYLLQDLKDGLKLSLKYSPERYSLRPLQFGVFGASVLGYGLSGALKGKMRHEDAQPS